MKENIQLYGSDGRDGARKGDCGRLSERPETKEHKHMRDYHRKPAVVEQKDGWREGGRSEIKR